MTEMFCLKCRYRTQGNYCRKCGSKLEDLSCWDMKCECGKEVTPWDTYCTNCGRVIGLDAIIVYLDKKEEND